MLAPGNSALSIDEISKELEEIESKYSSQNYKKCPRISIDLNESISVLSKVFQIELL